MNKKFPKPRVFASRCLGFEACRWNGAIIPDKFVEKLKPHVEYITTCPEADIGLGVPRDPIRIIFTDGSFRLAQLNTGRDVTDLMRDYAREYVRSLEGMDGFILKDRSPSCGLKDVKVYPGLKANNVIKKTSGFFAREVIDRYPALAVETEGRLTNYNLRENFLTKIFTLASFRGIEDRRQMKDLVDFHARNKFLLMAYDQEELALMGRVVANHEKKPAAEVFSQYREHLGRALGEPPKYTQNINVMMHGLGYFSKELTEDEKRFFLNSLEEYRREQVPLSVPVSLLRSFIVRFREEYLMQQTFFEPYPIELVAVKDSGKGREF
ncbi:MAG: DUF1722 domain-containing protein [Candidatus Omnitrophica bacterium]|nr:DUF1722 domain-containing protein [Candidatus Omnitrophota bacterium]